jgi:menaquinone-dependent protoporphyrinogen oxidase
MDAVPRVLVAYATAAGSTTGIAGRIAGVLAGAGCQVWCRPAGPDLDVGDFDAIVLGSAVHNMAWLPPALDLLGRAVTRVHPPVWCFSVGGVNPRGRLTRAVAAREVQRVERQFPAGFAPRDHRVFGGIVEMKGVPLWGRLFYRATGGRQGDHRDWPTIEAWARGVARELTTTPGAGNRRR